MFVKAQGRHLRESGCAVGPFFNSPNWLAKMILVPREIMGQYIIFVLFDYLIIFTNNQNTILFSFLKNTYLFNFSDGES